MRKSALIKHDAFAHYVIVKKDNGVTEYCNKDTGRLDGPFTYGIKPARKDKAGDTARKNMEVIELGPEKALEQGLIPLKDYDKIVKSVNLYKIRTGQAMETEDCRGIWIWGPPGTGKSHYARHEWGDSFYVKAQNKWFDGYNGESTIIMDDHDSPCLSHLIKLWTDKYKTNGEVKGHIVPLQHTRFVVTSNFSIAELYKDQPLTTIDAIQRRFKVHHFNTPFKKP